ncbi:MAG TPA: SDR family NAD(P)-dependent oxidoreductase, partial [Candidatus Atribacteria bacterium]|nr:SDR family NAD(P)-dependent oxidoreductase [Candidatus Atribacteria bacterium]
MGRFDKKIVFLTGSGGGIGRAIAERFAREGAVIVLTDIDNDALLETLGIIKDNSPHSVIYKLDVTDENMIRDVVKKIINKFGK